MIIVGCDFHPKWQQVAVLDAETGEIGEHKLMNGDGEAERFYRTLPAPARVGIEACGNSQWFVDLLEQLGHEVWIGDAAQIRASYVRKQKTDRAGGPHLNYPSQDWVPQVSTLRPGIAQPIPPRSGPERLNLDRANFPRRVMPEAGPRPVLWLFNQAALDRVPVAGGPGLIHCFIKLRVAGGAGPGDVIKPS
jgi:hypothetical protein